MRVTLDLTDLVQRREITREEADKLARLARQDTGSLGANVLFGFGVVAVALGGWALFPTAQSIVIGGVILFAAGLAMAVNQMTRWAIFAQICMVLGALGVAGGVSWMSDGNFYIELGLAIGLMAAAFAAASGLLGALAILQLAVALGASTAYWHASYALGVDRPALTIGVLSAVTLILFFISLRLPSAYERVAMIAARTAILMINAAFLVGSLWGDQMLNWPASLFTTVWAILLIGVGLWGVFANRRWIVNAAAVFGAIHFCTQWFEYFGPNALSILGGGILLIGFGFALAWLNARASRLPAAGRGAS